MSEDDKLKLDYERTAQYFFHLAEVRFKLLALLPIASGTALAIIPAQLGPGETLAVGVFGLIATIGILLYDQRNSQIYNCLIGRANLIEESLRLPAMRHNKQVGGAFLDRPGKGQWRKLLATLPANHGLGLNLIYSASAGSWLFVITAAILRLGGYGSEVGAASLLLPLVLALLVFLDLQRVDRSSEWEGDLPADIKSRIDKRSD